MKDIERAVEFLKDEISYCENVLGKNIVSNNYRRIALQALQSELDRQENKPLTIEELKEMVGEPVWVNVIVKPNYTFYRTGYGLVCCTRRKNICVMQDYDMLSLDYKTIVDLLENKTIEFYKHEPKEGE